MARKYTNLLLEAVEGGSIDKDQFIRDLLCWMDESEVKDMYEKLGYYELFETEEEEENDPMDDFN